MSQDWSALCSTAEVLPGETHVAWFGDVPLLTYGTMKRLLHAVDADGGADIGGVGADRPSVGHSQIFPCSAVSERPCSPTLRARLTKGGRVDCACGGA